VGFYRATHNATHVHSAVYAIETAGWIELVLGNVNSRSRSLYAVARPSVVCLPVVCLSVTLLRRTQPVEILGNISTEFATLAIR